MTNLTGVAMAIDLPAAPEQPSLLPVVFVLALFLGALGAAAGTTSGNSGSLPLRAHTLVHGARPSLLLTSEVVPGR